LVNGLRRCPQGGAHRAPPETLARFKGAASWQRKTGRKQGMDKRGKEREGIVALPTPGVDGLERLRMTLKLLDCFENWGHGRIRQRNHPRQISCQFIQAVRFKSVISSNSSHHWATSWRSGRTSDLRSRGREFDPRPSGCVTILGKLFTPMCLFHQAVFGTGVSRGVNRHTTRCTYAVSMVLQHKLMSD